jgi:hypothetical protein
VETADPVESAARKTADPVESAARKTAEQIDAAALALAEEEAATEVVSDVDTDIAIDQEAIDQEEIDQEEIDQEEIDQEAIDQEETAIQVANEAIDQVTGELDQDAEEKAPPISEADLKVIRQLQERLAFERLELGKKHLQLRQSFHLQETAQIQDRIVDIEAKLINLPIVINAVTEGKIDSNDAIAILGQLNTVDRGKRAIAKLQLQLNDLGTTKEKDWRRKELTKEIDRYQSTMNTAQSLVDAALSGGPEAYQNALRKQDVAGDKAKSLEEITNISRQISSLESQRLSANGDQIFLINRQLTPLYSKRKQLSLAHNDKYPSSTGKGLPQPQKSKTISNDMTRRFKILQGEVLAGNDNPMIIKELTHLITKLKAANMLVSV